MIEWTLYREDRIEQETLFFRSWRVRDNQIKYWRVSKGDIDQTELEYPGFQFSANSESRAIRNNILSRRLNTIFRAGGVFENA